MAAGIRIQYGGSANAKNAPDLSSMPDIDGFLVRSLVITPLPFPSYPPTDLSSMPYIDAFRVTLLLRNPTPTLTLTLTRTLIALIPGGWRVAQARVLRDRRRLCRQRLVNLK